ncbi:dihydrofolate reductase family protein [Actinoplanes sp. CA-142083]|uniref:dihydrofolate reductase family protein n=1 Tax=Actinoplanes sp. CA-142083 TaxID=3239903 RepID=UPI003D946E62
MGDVIVIQFATLDGVVSDPDGRGGTGYGGWAFRYGPGPVADDKFRLGAKMEDGVLLYGRRTWESFATFWPTRDDNFSRRMNAATKRVATRTGIDAGKWENSAAVDGDPVAWVKQERERRDIMVIGSLSLVHALAAADLIDEYRLITFPVVVGEGERLFAGGVPAEFRFTSVEPLDVTALTVLRRAR